MKNKILIGRIIMLLSFLFAVSETIYFGMNWIPKTNDEKICDLVSLGIFLTGYLIYDTQKQNRRQWNSQK